MAGTCRGFFTAVLVSCFLAASASAVRAAAVLPRFTEEREAAALFFVKKHCPELIPLLDELKKNAHTQYEMQVREIFQTTEMLADLTDERRHDVELKIWKTENRAIVLVAKLAAAKDEERKPLETQLQDIAKELVDLDISSLEAMAEQLEKDLVETKDELTRLKENADKSIKERYESLLDKAKKRRKLP